MTEADAAQRGRLAATLRALLVHPGTITRATWEGHGADYMGLGRLLAGCAAAFFLLTAWQQRTAAAPAPKTTVGCAWEVTGLVGSLGAAGAGNTGAPLDASSSPALQLADRLLCNPQLVTRAFAIAVPVAFLLLMPVSAGLMLLTFRKEQPTFAANWTYGLEAHSALFFVLAALVAIGLLGSFVLGVLASVGGLFYTTWNVVAGVERAYGVSSRTAIWRTGAVGAGYAVLLAVLSAALMAVLLRGV